MYTHALAHNVLHLSSKKIFSYRIPYVNPPTPNDLSVRLLEHMYPFLQCSALFFNCLSGIDFIHSSGMFFVLCMSL